MISLKEFKNNPFGVISHATTQKQYNADVARFYNNFVPTMLVLSGLIGLDVTIGESMGIYPQVFNFTPAAEGFGSMVGTFVLSSLVGTLKETQINRSVRQRLRRQTS